MSPLLVPKTPAEQLLYSTVRIQTQNGDGGTGVGTGFFYVHRIDESRWIPLIMTNKHVIEGAQVGNLRLHLNREKDGNAPSGVFYDLQITDFEKCWIGHPDPSIDLCAALLGNVENAIKRSSNRDLFHCFISSDQIPGNSSLEELDALEECVHGGLPAGAMGSS